MNKPFKAHKKPMRLEPSMPSLLEQEAIFGVRRRERLAWTVASFGVITGLVGVTAVAFMLPLKETSAYLTIVDKDTGLATRAVSVEAASVSHSDAVRDSLLYGYVTDRETYDAHDNEARILGVDARSSNAARASLRSQWAEGSTAYPPALFGQSGKVTVDILSIAPISDTTSQVRFTKRFEAPGEAPREGKFYATVTYAFNPQTEKNATLVWENPFGFTVTDYRLTSETPK